MHVLALAAVAAAPSAVDVEREIRIHASLVVTDGLEPKLINLVT